MAKHENERIDTELAQKLHAQNTPADLAKLVVMFKRRGAGAVRALTAAPAASPVVPPGVPGTEPLSAKCVRCVKGPN